MVENLRANNKELSEKGKALNITQLNAVAFFVAHDSDSIKYFSLAPKKIQTRLALTDNGWCRLGTVFCPPDDLLSTAELQDILTIMNRINSEAGRPNDTDIIVRTAVQGGKNQLLSEPAFIIKPENLNTKELTDFKDIDYKEAMQKIETRWKMYHSENGPLQKQAIHGRLEVNETELRLDLGSNMYHPRSLERGYKTVTTIPVGSDSSSYNLNMFVPNRLTIQGPNLTNLEIKSFLRDFSSGGGQLEAFVVWMREKYPNYNYYVAEFRYYTQKCQQDERFNIMDINNLGQREVSEYVETRKNHSYSSERATPIAEIPPEHRRVTSLPNNIYQITDSNRAVNQVTDHRLCYNLNPKEKRMVECGGVWMDAEEEGIFSPEDR